jgi:hypothetical protein
MNYINYIKKMEDIEDPTNLTGISSLVNKSHVNDKLDLAAIEKSVNLAMDLMGKSPLDAALDFGKFLFQNK